MNCAIKIDNATATAIRNGGEIVAEKVAETEGFVGACNFELLNCGSFYRLLFDYKKMKGA